MSRKSRAPFAYNKVFVAMCLVAMPGASALAVTAADNGEHITITTSPDDPIMTATNSSTIETNGNFITLNSTEDGVAMASATNGSSLIFTKGPTLIGSGSAADTIYLDSSTLMTTASPTSITTTGAGSWSINAQNNSTVTLEGASISASGAGGVQLGNGSQLTANGARVSATDSATAIQINADSSVATAELIESQIVSQNSNTINITNGNLTANNSSISSKGDGANAINAVSDANVIIIGTAPENSMVYTDGVNSSAVLLGAGTTLTSQKTLFKTNGNNAHVINSQGGQATLSGDLVETSGVGSHGLSASGGTIIGQDGLTIEVGGDSGVGAYATTNGTVNLTDTSVNAATANATGLFAATDGTVNANATTVTMTGNTATAVRAEGGTVSLQKSTLKTTSDGSTGIFSGANGTVASPLGLTVNTTGANSAAVVANSGYVTLGNATLSTSGTDSVGVYSTAAGYVDLGSSDVITTGENAYALAVNQGSILQIGGTLNTSNAAAIYGTGNDTNAQAGDINLEAVTVNAGLSAIQSNGGILNVTSIDTTFNSGTDLVLDVQTDAAGANSTVNLKADSSILNGSLVSDSAQNISNVTLNNGSTLTGYSQNISSIELDSTSNWKLTANSDVQSLTNNGTITFDTSTSGDVKTLTVNGDYSGNGGKLIMNTQLGDDSSPTDKLVVTGNVNAGDTLVAINNLGGSGAYTVEGIQVVSVGGVSEGTFTKSGRIVAGAYDYNLEKINESWYLTNKAPDVTDPGVTDPGVTDPGVTDPGVTDPGVTDPGVTDPGVTDPGPGPDDVSQYRPETGSYLANMLAANTMFDHRMQDRLGEGGYARSAEGAHADGLWMRHVGSHNRFYDDSAQLKARTNRYVLQLGYDLAQWSSDGYDRWHVGVMGGYGNAQSNIRSEITGYRADSKVEGYSAGVYATWVESDKDMSGAYVDSWVLYNWFRNTINGEALATEKYDSKGFTASLEAGYTVPMTKGERVSSWLQPKVQLTWMDVGADNHREHNGTWVTDDTDGTLRSRVGVRAYLKGHSELDNNTGRDFQPFVEANWLHNFGDYSVKMDDVTNSIAGDKNVGELKLGVEGKMANDFTMWGNVAQQVGSAGYSDTTVMFGARVNF